MGSIFNWKLQIEIAPVDNFLFIALPRSCDLCIKWQTGQYIKYLEKAQNSFESDQSQLTEGLKK
jgi:hypothetical protein